MSPKPGRQPNRPFRWIHAFAPLLLAASLLTACDLSDPAPRLASIPDTTRARIARECAVEFQGFIASVDTVRAQINPDSRYYSGRIWGPIEPPYSLLRGLLDGDSTVHVARNADSSVEITLLSAKGEPLFRVQYAPGPGIDSLLDRSLDALARYRVGHSLSPRMVVESRIDGPDPSDLGGEYIFRHEAVDLDGDGRIVLPSNRRSRVGMLHISVSRLGSRKVRMILGPGPDGLLGQGDDDRWFRLEECYRSGTDSNWKCSDLVAEDTVQGIASFYDKQGRLTWTDAQGSDTMSVARLSYAAGVPYLLSFRGTLSFAGSRHSIRLAPWTESLRRLMIEDPSDTIEVRFASPDIDLRFTPIAQVVRHRALPGSAPWSTTTFQWTPAIPRESMSYSVPWRFVATRTDALGRSERIQGRAARIWTGRDSIAVEIDSIEFR